MEDNGRKGWTQNFMDTENVDREHGFTESERMAYAEYPSIPKSRMYLLDSQVGMHLIPESHAGTKGLKRVIQGVGVKTANGKYQVAGTRIRVAEGIDGRAIISKDGPGLCSIRAITEAGGVVIAAKTATYVYDG